MQETLLKLISLGSIGIIVCLFIYIFLEIFKIKNPIRKLISDNRLQLLFLFSLGGTVGSILLSLYFKLEPCELCWYQRVFLFCTPVITFIALLKKEKTAHIYIFWLSLMGLCVSIYHSLLQSKIFVADTLFCNPGSTIDCSIPAFTYYGFVTVPVIAFAMFLLLVVVSYDSKRT
jgi:disulfide bond formation protein DsbB